MADLAAFWRLATNLFFRNAVDFSALTALYASLQFFISSLLDLGLYAAIFILAILVNQLPFLSSLMYLRYSAHWADGLLGSALCLLAAWILSRMIKYIDFSLE
ncbi:membrane protein [Lactobacillus delbrueckii subsp. bulgaricus]|uniref:hypothetical protein n=1 Tax=Lactobacillus delbrueckii TaxID=1584 RepID=UPI000E10BCC3|nr:hypothetical protein [Lactobacillus delbrueckii]AXI15826.1 membrane protein [Lactobacillus delbrueckii subsp. bulgaricus]